MTEQQAKMTYLHRKQCLQDCINRLCREFDVPKPFFRIPDEWNKENTGGMYFGWPPCIELNPYWYEHDIGTALKIVRHEFGHYLCERHDRFKREEKNCVKFEKNLFAFGILPKFQTTLDLFSFPVQEAVP